ncbi:MAG TPA: YlxR family protein [Methylomirabilota bacterium]|nr:YlxR family protein [Methylomirabilota bacterium]
MKHVPTRTCLGCRQRRAKHELVRLVRDGDGSVVVDEDGRGTGRGAYVCADPACTERALKAARLGHAFRAACRVGDGLEASVLAPRQVVAGAGHDRRS